MTLCMQEVPVPTEDSVTAAARTHALINTRQSLATLKENVDRMKVDVRSSFVEAAGVPVIHTRAVTCSCIRKCVFLPYKQDNSRRLLETSLSVLYACNPMLRKQTSATSRS